MAWVAHQIVRDPVHLFEANIFYPERHTLAFSEHLFVQSMMGAPVAWAGGQPVLVYNLVLIAGFALTGWTTAMVIQRWTGSWLAGVLSGSLMAFNAMTLTRLSHIQILHLEFFPLALLAFDRLLAVPRAKHALQLALWYVLQSLTSVYWLVFAAVALVTAAWSARPNGWVRVLAPWCRCFSFRPAWPSSRCCRSCAHICRPDASRKCSVEHWGRSQNSRRGSPTISPREAQSTTPPGADNSSGRMGCFQASSAWSWRCWPCSVGWR